MYSKQKRLREEGSMAIFKVLSQNLPSGSEKYKKTFSWCSDQEMNNEQQKYKTCANLLCTSTFMQYEVAQHDGGEHLTIPLTNKIQCVKFCVFKATSTKMTVFWNGGPCSFKSASMKEAVCASETLLNTYQTMWFNISEDMNLQKSLHLLTKSEFSNRVDYFTAHWFHAACMYKI
jgi:hypothetical protein